LGEGKEREMRFVDDDCGCSRRWERKKIRVSNSFSLGFPPDG